MFFSNLKFQAVTRATRTALNRTANQTRNFAVKRMREERKLPAGSLKRRIFIHRARGNQLSRMHADIRFTGISLPLILFVKGSKSPRRGKGPTLSFEIRKGTAKQKKGLYIAKAKHGKERYQVFRRRDPGSKTNRRHVKQSASSIVELFRTKVALRTQIQNHASLRFQKNFASALEFQLLKLKK